MNEPQPTPWTCPACGATRLGKPDQNAACPKCKRTVGQPTRTTRALRLILLGLAPSPVLVIGLQIERLPPGIEVSLGLLLMVLTMSCSLIGGFGLVARSGNAAVQSVLGMFLSAVFFVINLGAVFAVALHHELATGL